MYQYVLNIISAKAFLGYRYPIINAVILVNIWLLNLGIHELHVEHRAVVEILSRSE
jgi:hypothetical protein